MPKVGDALNGDGIPDLVVANWFCFSCWDNYNATVGVLIGNGDGTFQPAVIYFAGRSPTVEVGLLRAVQLLAAVLNVISAAATAVASTSRSMPRAAASPRTFSVSSPPASRPSARNDCSVANSFRNSGGIGSPARPTRPLRPPSPACS